MDECIGNLDSLIRLEDNRTSLDKLRLLRCAMCIGLPLPVIRYMYSYVCYSGNIKLMTMSLQQYVNQTTVSKELYDSILTDINSLLITLIKNKVNS